MNIETKIKNAVENNRLKLIEGIRFSFSKEVTPRLDTNILYKKIEPKLEAFKLPPNIE